MPEISVYLKLVDWTGRVLREDKPDILLRLNLDATYWAYLAQEFDSPFKSLVETAYKIRQASKETGHCWAHGIRRCADVISRHLTNTTLSLPNPYEHLLNEQLCVESG